MTSSFRLPALPAILLTVILLLAACNSGDGETDGAAADEDQPVTVAVFLASAANTYSQAQLEGAEDAAEELNATVEFFDGEFDSSKQFTQIQDAIQSGRFDAFVVSANDGNAMVPVIEEAIAADIKVACALAPCGDDLTTLEPQVENLVAHAGTTFPDNGAQIANLVVEACGDRDPCNVAYIPGLLESAPYEVARLDGLESVLDEHDNIEVVATQEGGYLAEPALKVTEDLLQSRQDIHVIASSGDQMIVGAEQAVEDAGLTDQIALVGNGASRIGVKAIQEGRWYGSPVYMPYTEGKEATDRVIRAARGEDLEGEAINTDDFSSVGPVVTKENADEYEPEWEG
jgi:ribose transport system substrate-binding protein